MPRSKRATRSSMMEFIAPPDSTQSVRRNRRRNVESTLVRGATRRIMTPALFGLCAGARLALAPRGQAQPKLCARIAIANIDLGAHGRGQLADERQPDAGTGRLAGAR